MLFKQCLLVVLIIVVGSIGTGGDFLCLPIYAQSQPDLEKNSRNLSAPLIAPIKLVDDNIAVSPEIVAASHENNKILDLRPLYLSSAVHTSSSKYLIAEASYDQSITLADALSYVLNHGLPLKISQESFKLPALGDSF